ncbi:helix-turn-helix domain-containing protein [Streptococcus caviae]|uniref:helix-turn-helix domain-containing protein n=1 Tax=Streptococcus sp. 'caviae' TaxID=1915004 RepID=UPI0035A89BAD
MDEPVALRYCRFLLEHSKLINGRYELPKFFKYQEIADYLAIHPVTVAKLTKTLAIQNILSKSGQQIIIRDHQALTRLLADQDDFDY